MKVQKTNTLPYLFGKHLLNPKWTNFTLELNLSNMDLTDAHLEALDCDSYHLFRAMPMLKHLNLSQNQLSLHSAHWLAKGILQNKDLFLHHLDLYGNQLGNKGVKLLMHTLSTCKKLKYLNIGKNNIDDGGASDIITLIDPSLKTCGKLKSLLVADNRLTSVGCSKILSCLKKRVSKKTKGSKAISKK